MQITHWPRCTRCILPIAEDDAAGAVSTDPFVTYPICQSAWWMNCGKMADWIWMPFGVVIGFSRRMGVLNWGGDRRRQAAVLGMSVGHPIVTNGDFVV